MKRWLDRRMAFGDRRAGFLQRCFELCAEGATKSLENLAVPVPPLPYNPLAPVVQLAARTFDYASTGVGGTHDRIESDLRELEVMVADPRSLHEVVVAVRTRMALSGAQPIAIEDLAYLAGVTPGAIRTLLNNRVLRHPTHVHQDRSGVTVGSARVWLQHVGVPGFTTRAAEAS